MVYLASGGFWTGVGQVSSALASFVSALLFANFLPRETFGVYRYVLTLAGILNSFSLTGLRGALADIRVRCLRQRPQYLFRSAPVLRIRDRHTDKIYEGMRRVVRVSGHGEEFRPGEKRDLREFLLQALGGARQDSRLDHCDLPFSDELEGSFNY